MNIEERNAALTRRRWGILTASCLVNLCIGAMYAWSVFSTPMAAHLSAVNGIELTAKDLSVVFSIGNSDGFIMLIAGGFINQKFGPKWVIFTGGVVFGIGFIVCGFATSVGMLIFGYGILVGLAMGLAYGCTISNSVKFFPDKAGLIGGIATASYGISSVILPPIANSMIGATKDNPEGNVCKVFIIFGIFVVAVVAICSMFIQKCPDDFVPSGWDPSNSRKKQGVTVVDKDWKGMLSSPVFYVMIIMLFFGAVFGMMIISQASQIAQNMIGMSAGSAAVVVSVLALFNTFGRILCGRIADKIGCINTLTSVFVLAIAALMMLYISGNIQSSVLFIVGICLIGVCFGAFMGVYPSFTAQNFGPKNSSVNYGIMFIGFSAAGLAGPMISVKFADAVVPYQPAFLVAAVLAVAGLALSFAYRAFVRKAQNSTCK